MEGSVGEESFQMWELNRRLEVYLSRVKALEEQNELLNAELSGLRARSGDASWRTRADDELAALRALVDQHWREKHAAEVERDNLAEELEGVAGRCLQLRLARERNAEEAACSRRAAEAQQSAQGWLSTQVAELERELEVLRAAHEEERAHLHAQAACAPSEPPALPRGPRVPTPEVEELARRLGDAWRGAVRGYQERVAHMESSLGQAREQLGRAVQGSRETRRELQQLLAERDGLQERREALEQRLENCWQDRLRATEKFQLAVEALEQEKQGLQSQIAQVLEGRQQLAHLKMSLSLEVATYRTLLEAENSRLQIPGGSSQASLGCQDPRLQLHFLGTPEGRRLGPVLPVLSQMPLPSPLPNTLETPEPGFLKTQEFLQARSPTLASTPIPPAPQAPCSATDAEVRAQVASLSLLQTQGGRPQIPEPLWAEPKVVSGLPGLQEPGGKQLEASISHFPEDQASLVPFLSSDHPILEAKDEESGASRVSIILQEDEGQILELVEKEAAIEVKVESSLGQETQEEGGLDMEEIHSSQGPLEKEILKAMGEEPLISLTIQGHETPGKETLKYLRTVEENLETLKSLETVKQTLLKPLEEKNVEAERILEKEVPEPPNPLGKENLRIMKQELVTSFEGTLETIPFLGKENKQVENSPDEEKIGSFKMESQHLLRYQEGVDQETLRSPAKEDQESLRALEDRNQETLRPPTKEDSESLRALEDGGQVPFKPLEKESQEPLESVEEEDQRIVEPIEKVNRESLGPLEEDQVIERLLQKENQEPLKSLEEDHQVIERPLEEENQEPLTSLEKEQVIVECLEEKNQEPLRSLEGKEQVIEKSLEENQECLRSLERENQEPLRYLREEEEVTERPLEEGNQESLTSLEKEQVIVESLEEKNQEPLRSLEEDHQVIGRPLEKENQESLTSLEKEQVIVESLEEENQEPLRSLEGEEQVIEKSLEENQECLRSLERENQEPLRYLREEEEVTEKPLEEGNQESLTSLEKEQVIVESLEEKNQEPLRSLEEDHQVIGRLLEKENQESLTSLEKEQVIVESLEEENQEPLRSLEGEEQVIEKSLEENQECLRSLERENQEPLRYLREEEEVTERPLEEGNQESLTSLEKEQVIVESLEEKNQEPLRSLEEDHQVIGRLLEKENQESLTSLEKEQVIVESLEEENQEPLRSLEGEEKVIEKSLEENQECLRSLERENQEPLRYLREEEEVIERPLEEENQESLTSLEKEQVIVESLEEKNQESLRSLEGETQVIVEPLEKVKRESLGPLEEVQVIGRLLEKENQEPLRSLEGEEQVIEKSLEEENQKSLRSLEEDHQVIERLLEKENQKSLTSLEKEQVIVESLEEENQEPLRSLEGKEQVIEKSLEENQECLRSLERENQEPLRYLREEEEAIERPLEEGNQESLTSLEKEQVIVKSLEEKNPESLSLEEDHQVIERLLETEDLVSLKPVEGESQETFRSLKKENQKSSRSLGEQDQEIQRSPEQETQQTLRVVGKEDQMAGGSPEKANSELRKSLRNDQEKVSCLEKENQELLMSLKERNIETVKFLETQDLEPPKMAGEKDLEILTYLNAQEPLWSRGEMNRETMKLRENEIQKSLGYVEKNEKTPSSLEKENQDLRSLVKWALETVQSPEVPEKENQQHLEVEEGLEVAENLDLPRSPEEQEQELPQSTHQLRWKDMVVEDQELGQDLPLGRAGVDNEDQEEAKEQGELWLVASGEAWRPGNPEPKEKRVLAEEASRKEGQSEQMEVPGLSTDQGKPGVTEPLLENEGTAGDDQASLEVTLGSEAAKGQSATGAGLEWKQEVVGLGDPGHLVREEVIETTLGKERLEAARAQDLEGPGKDLKEAKLLEWPKTSRDPLEPLKCSEVPEPVASWGAEEALAEEISGHDSPQPRPPETEEDEVTETELGLPDPRHTEAHSLTLVLEDGCRPQPRAEGSQEAGWGLEGRAETLGGIEAEHQFGPGEVPEALQEGEESKEESEADELGETLPDSTPLGFYLRSPASPMWDLAAQQSLSPQGEARKEGWDPAVLAAWGLEAPLSDEDVEKEQGHDSDLSEEFEDLGTEPSLLSGIPSEVAEPLDQGPSLLEPACWDQGQESDGFADEEESGEEGEEEELEAGMEPGAQWWGPGLAVGGLKAQDYSQGEDPLEREVVGVSGASDDSLRGAVADVSVTAPETKSQNSAEPSGSEESGSISLETENQAPGQEVKSMGPGAGNTFGVNGQDPNLKESEYVNGRVVNGLELSEGQETQQALHGDQDQGLSLQEEEEEENALKTPWVGSPVHLGPSHFLKFSLREADRDSWSSGED